MYKSGTNKEKSGGKNYCICVAAVFRASDGILAAVVSFNVSQGWYSKDEESVRAEIFTETADFALGEIIDRYVNYGSQE